MTAMKTISALRITNYSDYDGTSDTESLIVEKKV